MNRYWILISLWWATFSALGAEFYVAPNGQLSGDGRLASPWGLQTALSQPGSIVKPGDTLWLRGGSYTGATNIWYAALNGASNAPILVRQYPGERATVNGGLYVAGSWTWYWGFEITNPDPERNVTNNFARPEGIEIHGRGCKAINLVIHDTGHPGIGFWKQIGDGAEVYGCILWGSGMYDWSSGTMDIRGAGIYGQGETADENRFIRDSIFFRNFTQGIHLYSTAAGVYVNGMHIEGNIFFNNGDACQNLFIGTVAQPCQRISILNNCIYFNPGDSGTGIRLGYVALNNAGIELKGNYVVGGSTSMLINDWQNVTLIGNSVLGSKERLVQISRAGGFAAFDYLCNSNTYASTYANPFLYSETVGLIPFARWKADIGYDANSSFSSSLPAQTKMILRPNQYERGRAHIAVFNWGLQSSVSVDLSTVGLNVGDVFEIRDVQNYFGVPVFSGTYNGAPVVLPMNLTTVPALIGNVTHITNKHTGTDFGAFVVVPTGLAPSPLNRPPTLAPISPKTIIRGSLLTFTNTATDPDLPASKLTFSLAAGAPTGAGINPTNGVFTWRPASSQFPGAYLVTVGVTDSGIPALSDAKPVTIVVTDLNTAPVLAAIPNKTNYEGSTFSFTASASDTNVPAQTLTFSLDAPVPAGASVTPGGLFTWTPASAQAPSTNLFTMRVTDNGTPSLSNTRAFKIVVRALSHATAIQHSLSGAMTIRWVAIPRKTYQVQYKNSLEDPNWTNLGAIFKANGTSGSVTDTTGSRAQRFYRVLLVK